jgi:hypothetical protein
LESFVFGAKQQQQQQQQLSQHNGSSVWCGFVSYRF